MAWILAAGAVASAAMGAYSANRAGKAVAGGSKEALAEQARQYNNAIAMLEPQRALGYGAIQDIGSLYGYAVPAYNTLTGYGRFCDRREAAFLSFASR